MKTDVIKFDGNHLLVRFAHSLRYHTLKYEPVKPVLKANTIYHLVPRLSYLIQFDLQKCVKKKGQHWHFLIWWFQLFDNHS